MKSDDAGVAFCDGTVLHSSQCEAGFGVDWMTAIVKVTSSLSRPPTVDLSSLASLAALTLVTGLVLRLSVMYSAAGHFNNSDNTDMIVLDI